jgi:hypothetical protein
MPTLEWAAGFPSESTLIAVFSVTSSDVEEFMSFSSQDGSSTILRLRLTIC